MQKKIVKRKLKKNIGKRKVKKNIGKRNFKKKKLKETNCKKKIDAILANVSGNCLVQVPAISLLPPTAKQMGENFFYQKGSHDYGKHLKKNHLRWQ